MRTTKTASHANRPPLLAFLFVCAALWVTSCAPPPRGEVVDAETGKPINGAILVHEGRETRSDASGRFAISHAEPGKPLLAKAPGYRRASLNLNRVHTAISLRRFDCKGIYLSYAGLKSDALRDNALSLLGHGGLNTLVVDLKGDRGLTSFNCQSELGRETRSKELPPIEDLAAFIKKLHEKDIYLIARIAVFKDSPLAKCRPKWAVQDSNTGKLWQDGERQHWMDPFCKEVWDYNLSLAAEAADAGFDEIQFDHFALPSSMRFDQVDMSKTPTVRNRRNATTAFLETAQDRLRPWNVHISLATYISALVSKGNQSSSPDLEELSALADYICPRIFPSLFPAKEQPLDPGEIVRQLLQSPARQFAAFSQQVRPWLQGYSDPRKKEQPFEEKEIASQIKACDLCGAAGWLLWDPSNHYQHTAEALRLAATPATNQPPQLP